jgi:hypothetical protein
MSNAKAHLLSILQGDPGVDAGYRHSGKKYESGEPLELPGSILKWYELHALDMPVPADVSLLARRHIVSSGAKAPGFGFVILHRCGLDFYFLIVCSWRNSNEIWETVFYKNGDTMREFAVFPRLGSHLPTFCVWELAPVMREKAAWERFLLSARDEAAAAAWLAERGGGEA